MDLPSAPCVDRPDVGKLSARFCDKKKFGGNGGDSHRGETRGQEAY